MELANTSKRIHPLVAGAACSVILVSLLGAAAITGILPSSNSTATSGGNTMPTMGSNANLTNPAVNTAMPVSNNGNQPAANYANSQYASPQYANTAQNNYPAPAPVKVAQSSNRHQPARNYQAQPAQAQNSPVGIGVGAVIGGLVGSQIGNGNGRTLATIAGAVGGGYVGNEVAKRNP
ncbi:glycine zipper 2TM domain-containing protein [Undibacterium sp. Ji83W]|uniref:glycine zipper 2TM domain-containing protein n=1 Tax=Undibacterium sp. Ji83W TaxID=3413043 RepID=UPI003BF389EF